MRVDTRTPSRPQPTSLLNRLRMTFRRRASGTGPPRAGAAATGSRRMGRHPGPPRLRIRWPLVLLWLAAAGVLAWLLVLSPLVGVREVAVAGVDGVARETIVRIGSDEAGAKPLVKVDTARIADEVIRLGVVAQVDVERRWPTTLVIRVKPRESTFALPMPQGGVQIFDAEGVPFWVVDKAPTGVPQVTLTDPQDPAQRRTAAIVVRALSAAQRARIKDLRVTSADRVTVAVGDVVVTWGGPERSDVKARIVDVLARRRGVATINVAVPESPVTGEGAATRPKG